MHALVSPSGPTTGPSEGALKPAVSMIIPYAWVVYTPTLQNLNYAHVSERGLNFSLISYQPLCDTVLSFRREQGGRAS